MSRDKRAIFDELVSEVRRSQAATDRLDEAVAQALAMNRTDMRCLDVLSRRGALTAGQLAAATGLTSGAMTTALDRLERAGYARRVRDGDDRRRVLVELTPQALADAGRFYQEHIELSERLYQRYTLEQIELLLDFVRTGAEFNEQHAQRIEDENRARGKAPRGERAPTVRPRPATGVSIPGT